MRDILWHFPCFLAKRMKISRILNLLIVFCLTWITTQIHAKTFPISDLVTIVNNNQLLGYGIVVGLKGAGDKNKTFLEQINSDRYQSLGPKFPSTVVQSENVAAVIVTANIPPNYKTGMRVDITVRRLGDAKSLQGGYLMQTTLLGVNHEVYAFAQGAISQKEPGLDANNKHPLTATIVNGGIVERETIGNPAPNAIKLLLRSPDRITAESMVSEINKKHPHSAKVLDLMSIRVEIPQNSTTSEFLTRLISMEIQFEK